jgi:hypothetical protein
MTTATLVTSAGNIEVRLLAEHAPTTVANFVDLATGKGGHERSDLHKVGPGAHDREHCARSGHERRDDSHWAGRFGRLTCLRDEAGRTPRGPADRGRAPRP